MAHTKAASLFSHLSYSPSSDRLLGPFVSNAAPCLAIGFTELLVLRSSPGLPRLFSFDPVPDRVSKYDY